MSKTIYTKLYRQIVSDLRKARIDKNLTQKRVCVNMAKAASWLSKIESCELRLDVLGYLQLCKIYDLSAGQFIAKYDLSKHGRKAI